MKKLINFVVLGCMLSNLAFADCDFKTGITQLPDGGYRYTKECHVKVGEIKQDLDIANQKVADLNQAITLKDLALTKESQRVKLWMDTTYNLEDRISKIDELRSKNQWMYFGLGVITAVGAGYMASKLIQR